MAASSTNAPSNSVAFTKAAAELGMIARECHRLALRTGDRNLIGEAEAGLEIVAGFAQARHLRQHKALMFELEGFSRFSST